VSRSRGRGNGVGWVLRCLGGDSCGSRGRDNWVAGVLRSLGGLDDRVAGVLGLSGSRSGSDLGGLSVSVLGDSGSEAGESSEGGNGVTHFG
jgi:hypothetical protein